MKEYKEIFDLIKSNKVKGICFDSREVEEGFLFIAQKGTNVDGHKFINTAISKGAKYIVCEFIPEDVKELAQKNNEILFIVVKNSSNALGYIASEYYDNPSKKLKIVGITGTNGKTTTVTL